MGTTSTFLRTHLKDESVDLIYLDPPFNSGRDYNATFADTTQDGGKSNAQIKAFTDTWSWDTTAALAYDTLVRQGGKVADILAAFHTVLGPSSTLAYLSMMAPRLIELHRVLKPTGSIYLHCDPTASHYLKMLMDAVFGRKNFRNEVVWCYTGPSAMKKDFPRKHDVVFRYSRSDIWIFNPDSVRVPYSEAFKSRRKYSEGKGGVFKGKGEHKAEAFREGKLPSDWWSDIPSGGQVSSKERLGYPTQKPLALLDRIILASSNVGDVVLDPFCGCGTCLDSAQALGRQWIGIDITHLAVGVIKNRMLVNHGINPGKDYQVVGEPVDLEGARALADQDKHQFQTWALGLVGAREGTGPAKKGGDRGIDGIKLLDDAGKMIKCIISVKAGNIGPDVIRDLRGTMGRESAPLGLLITLKPPTTGMVKEAVEAGFHELDGIGMFSQPVQKIQIATIEDLLQGKQPNWPEVLSNMTHRK